MYATFKMKTPELDTALQIRSLTLDYILPFPQRDLHIGTILNYSYSTGYLGKKKKKKMITVQPLWIQTLENTTDEPSRAVHNISSRFVQLVVVIFEERHWHGDSITYEPFRTIHSTTVKAIKVTCTKQSKKNFFPLVAFLLLHLSQALALLRYIWLFTHLGSSTIRN